MRVGLLILRMSSLILPILATCAGLHTPGELRPRGPHSPKLTKPT